MTSSRPSLTELIGKTAGMLVAYILALFLPADTFVWISSWAYVAIISTFIVGLTAWFFPYDPALLAERLGGLPQRPGEERSYLMSHTIRLTETIPFLKTSIRRPLFSWNLVFITLAWFTISPARRSVRE